MYRNRGKIMFRLIKLEYFSIREKDKIPISHDLFENLCIY